MYSVMWFRRDLRTADNPAFSAAMACGPTLAVFAITEETWQRHQLSPAKRSLLVRQLLSLEQQLRHLNVPLFTLDCSTFSHIPESLVHFCSSVGSEKVFFNHEYEIDERKCTKHAVSAFASNGVACEGFHDQCAIKPGDIKTATGGWYKVFTAFKNSYLSQFSGHARLLIPRPKKQKKLPLTGDSSALQNIRIENHWDKAWPAGEKYAFDQLSRFIQERVDDYHTWRDFPAKNAGCALSPYLSIGAISTRQCIHELLTATDRENEGPGCWLNELIWRDFYRHLMFAYPDICKYKAFKQETDRLPWKTTASLFKRWTEGRTGYPIVDAAMLQLKNKGWMHNRLRMVTAMFLCKHLFIDWRMGEKYFMQHLVDGDLASNNGGWQWSASTGVDAAPYFRIFNPVRQSQRFDPEGHFIRQYLPQLASLDNKAIHMPSPEQAHQCNYPSPIVDHRSATQNTKALFQALK